MADHADHVDFWTGLAMGSLAGLIVVAYARGDFRSLFSSETGYERDALSRGTLFAIIPGIWKCDARPQRMPAIRPGSHP